MTTPPLARLACSVLLFASAIVPSLGAQTRTNPDAATIADFKKRVDAYVALHKKVEATIPKLPTEATPQQIDQHQRALGKLIQENRTNAHPGDLLIPAMQRIVRRVTRQVFRSEGGAQLKKEILEEYTEPVVVKVNGRYPDTVPLSTVPPQVLQSLPPLPEELEYRFVGDRLILLDPHAHVIADYMVRIFP